MPEKLSRINNLASAQTSRKAHITSEQLGRRYNLIYDSLKSKKSFNMARIARWYNTQPEVTRRALERAEPFTWLKHLERRSGRSTRALWNLTALVMEEYSETQEQNRLMTIPEDSTLIPNVSYKRRSHSPSYSSPKPVSDDRISFEPLAESKSKRSSWDAVSLKSAESTPASVRTTSAIVPQLPTLSMHDGSKDMRASIAPLVGRAQASRLVSDDSGDDYLAASRSMVETSLVPEVSIHPPSTESAHMPSKSLLGPIVPASSTGSSDGVKPFASPTSQSPIMSRESSSKPKLMNRSHNTSRSSRRRKKVQEQREKQLRREYDAKSM